jgi:putative SOS response-associated peptidase YedK
MCVFISITPTGTEIESKYNKIFVPNEKDLFSKVWFTSAFTNPKLPIVAQEKPDFIQCFEWGLIPFWVKDEKAAKEIRKNTVNARAESIFEKPSFRSSIREKRCLVIADGFFEWREYSGKKYPYYIRLKSHEIFSMAGIYDYWRDKRTFSIITTEANPLMSKIHNVKKRMPVILKKKDEEIWLDNSLSIDKIKEMMASFDEKEMEAYTVSKFIVSRGIDTNQSKALERFEYEGLEAI